MFKHVLKKSLKWAETWTLGSQPGETLCLAGKWELGTREDWYVPDPLLCFARDDKISQYSTFSTKTGIVYYDIWTLETLKCPIFKKMTHSTSPGTNSPVASSFYKEDVGNDLTGLTAEKEEAWSEELAPITAPNHFIMTSFFKCAQGRQTSKDASQKYLSGEARHWLSLWGCSVRCWLFSASSQMVTSASGIRSSTGKGGVGWKSQCFPASPHPACRRLQLGGDGVSIWLQGGPFGSLSRVLWPVNVQHILTLKSSGSWPTACLPVLSLRRAVWGNGGVGLMVSSQADGQEWSKGLWAHHPLHSISIQPLCKCHVNGRHREGSHLNRRTSLLWSGAFETQRN